jgi:DNA-binding response OmpR family regulator
MGEADLPAQPDDSAAQDVPSVLVIDDSPLVRRLVQLALGNARGWQVHAAESGALGIEVAMRERPDAVLLDVEMPDLSGPETLSRLRSQEATRQVPVLFLTALSADSDRAELQALGAAGVIAKPFDSATLAAQVAGILEW